MLASKTKNGSSKVPVKTSPTTPKSSRASKTSRSEIDPAASKITPSNSSTERSPKIIDRRSPKSPDIEKRRLSRSSELKSEFALLQEELKKMKEHLSSSESSKQQLQQEADEAERKLIAKSEKFEESQLQLLVLSTAEENRLEELREVSQERDKAWQKELEALQKQHSVVSTALSATMNEIQMLKQQLNVSKSEAAHADKSETMKCELETLKEEMADTLSVIEELKTQYRERELAEEAAKFTVSETQKQLEISNATIMTLHADNSDLFESMNSLTSKLEESKIRIGALEEIITEYQKVEEDDRVEKTNPSCKLESEASKFELKQLESALKFVEAKRHDEQIRTKVQIQSAYEAAELTKFNARLRESELESTTEKAKIELSELKERLIDMQREVSRILGMNKELKEEMKNGESNRVETELKLIKATIEVTELEANLLEKNTALQAILEENETLNSELTKRESEHQVKYNAAIVDAQKAWAAEKEALKRTDLEEEAAEKSSKRAVKVLEQLEEAKAVNLGIEAELKRLKVHSDQWRKAAEAASEILMPGNNGRLAEDSENYSISGKLTNPPFSDEFDDDLPEKKSSSVVRKLGGLWKKSSK
ncbi:interactor of constitutive active ROPs 2, chloroplastic-like [Phalaenopsis equestris]|uniref:interactor of constitutive active ROPs 2, chloroplastic-like n=1 Tax=Phalaenopsis equestris TaxID=78828 RepID=UPI0009E61FBF|nr:interactor of constitutive active ROPs 2, chloroplastic-like [Phalaenopsis equestris]XP_020578881.1 interactor of constitutive active ROPs 2, chloroplastic-like [Phalaenopsis equestris]